MTTMAKLIDRVYRQYLEMPDDQPTITTTRGDVNLSETQILIDASVLAPEEISLLGVTTIMEIDREVMRVLAYDEALSRVTVRRASMGTEAATHEEGAIVRINPRYTRASIFDTLADVVAGRLYPTLYATNTELYHLESPMTMLYDDSARAIITVTTDWGEEIPVIFRANVMDQGPGLVVPPSYAGVDGWVTTRRTFERPTAESDDLADIGIPAEWDQLLITAAAADLLGGKEFDRASLEYLSESLEAQGFRLGEITNVSVAMLRFSQLLLAQAAAGLRADTPTRVEQTRVL